jgi:plastocyanin
MRCFHSLAFLLLGAWAMMVDAATNWGPNGEPATSAANWSITKYKPFSVELGDTITFIWDDTHTVSLSPNAKDYEKCSGAKTLSTNSPFTFDTSTLKGKFPQKVYIYCSLHCKLGMKVEITVEKPKGR